MTGPRSIASAALLVGMLSAGLAGAMTYLISGLFPQLRTIDGGGRTGLVIGMSAATGLFGLMLAGILTAFLEGQDFRRGFSISMAIILGLCAASAAAAWCLTGTG